MCMLTGLSIYCDPVVTKALFLCGAFIVIELGAIAHSTYRTMRARR